MHPVHWSQAPAVMGQGRSWVAVFAPRRGWSGSPSIAAIHVKDFRTGAAWLRGGEVIVSGKRELRLQGAMGGEAESLEGAPITTSAVLMSASKHITSKCGAQNRAFLDCKRADANPEKCLQQGQNVTRCVISLLRELNSKCPKAMESYTKCMDYYSNEFDMCRKEQQEFEASCPL